MTGATTIFSGGSGGAAGRVHQPLQPARTMKKTLNSMCIISKRSSARHYYPWRGANRSARVRGGMRAATSGHDGRCLLLRGNGREERAVPHALDPEKLT